MRTCPYCGREIDFLRFLTQFGSDTLVAHPGTLGIHRREHVCSKCRKILWLEYHKEGLIRSFKKHILVFAVIKTFGFLYGFLFLKMNFINTTLFTYILILLIFPIYLGWVKYESVEIKYEVGKGA